MSLRDPNKFFINPEERSLARIKAAEKRLENIERRGSSAVWNEGIVPHADRHAIDGNDPITPEMIQALSNTDIRIPTNAQKDALAGTTGTPGTLNRYVTDQDPRLVNAFARQTLTQTITVAAGQEVSVNIPLAKSFHLWSFASDKPCRFRLYATSSARSADQARSQTSPPASGIALITEIITTNSLLTVPMCPVQSGASLATTPTSNIPALIRNDGTSSGLQLTIIWTRAEN